MYLVWSERCKSLCHLPVVPLLRWVTDIRRVGQHVGPVDVINSFGFWEGCKVLVVQHLLSQFGLDTEQNIYTNFPEMMWIKCTFVSVKSTEHWQGLVLSYIDDSVGRAGGAGSWDWSDAFRRRPSHLKHTMNTVTNTHRLTHSHR